MKKDITGLFCWVDDFYISINNERNKIRYKNNSRKPTRITSLTDSEIVTIILMFQQSPCKNFKYFYNSYLQLYKPEFPKMPTYERFVALMPRVLYLLVPSMYVIRNALQEIKFSKG